MPARSRNPVMSDAHLPDGRRRWTSLIIMAGAAAVFAGDAVAQQDRSAQPPVERRTAPGWRPDTAIPEKIEPSVPDEGSGSSSPRAPLSDELSRSGGVIKPPDMDPHIKQPVPDTGPQSMPVIPPPGTPGGNPEIKPK
jgi:hypothetical protein